MVSQRVPKCPSLSRRVPADSQCFPAYFWVSHSHFGRKRGKMSPSQRRPNASQPILACPKTCSSRLSSVPRPSRQSINCRTVGVRHLQGFQIDAFQIVPRHAKVCHTNRPKRQKKQRKKKESFFFQANDHRSQLRTAKLRNEIDFFFVLLFFCFKPGAT